MKRGMVIGVAGVAIVVAGVAGCSSSKSNTSSSSSSQSSASSAKVTVAGQNQNVNGAVSCTPATGDVTIGIGDPTKGIGAVVTSTTPPAVHSIGLGSVNGIVMGYSDAAASQGNAQAMKTGNSYKITGTATGVDMANPQQPVTKPFEIDVTCP